MSNFRVRRATIDDFRAYAGDDPWPEWVIAPIGYVAERDGRPIALGIVTWDDSGRAWGWFDAREHLPAVSVHRRALAMLAALRAAGEPALYTFCSQSIPGAATWLNRLGFHPMPEMTTDPEHPVWLCALSMS